MFELIVLCHVLAAIGLGPIFTIPLLAGTSTALHSVLVFLRFGAGVSLVSGILLWVVLKPVHPLWLYASSAMFFVVIVLIAVVLAPAAGRLSEHQQVRGRIRWTGIVASTLTFGIAVLMMLRPSWA